MRFNNADIVINADATAPVVSKILDTSQMYKISVQMIFSAANDGSVIVEASNEQVMPSNFSVISTTAISAATLVLVPQFDICYRWLRITYTPSSGAGTVSINCELIGF